MSARKWNDAIEAVLGPPPNYEQRVERCLPPDHVFEPCTTTATSCLDCPVEISFTGFLENVHCIHECHLHPVPTLEEPDK